jgi:hypothetical protein
MVIIFVFLPVAVGNQPWGSIMCGEYLPDERLFIDKKCAR